jgi:hypothetical protein
MLNVAMLIVVAPFFVPNLDDCANVCATANAALSSSEIRKTQLNRLS